MAENNENMNVPEKSEEEVKATNKDNFFVGGLKKIAKAGSWVVKKVSDHPKIAIGVLLDVGIAIGYVGKTVLEILTDSPDETGPIETTFTDDDSEADSSDESSTDDE